MSDLPILLKTPVGTPFGRAQLVLTSYASTGFPAIELMGDDGPIARLSVNPVMLPAPLSFGEVCIKTWAENEPLVKPMLASGLFERTGQCFPQGFVDIEVWRMKGELLDAARREFESPEEEATDTPSCPR